MITNFREAADYATLWGGDPVYDHPPNEKGDGYLFYNYNVLGHDPEFCGKFVPAIERTIEYVQQHPDTHQPNDVAELTELLKFVKGFIVATPRKRAKLLLGR